MPRLKNLFTDYDGTFDPRHLEIPLAYEILDYHRKQGNAGKYLSLKYPKQIKMCIGFKTMDHFKLLKMYVDEILKGESRELIESAAQNVAERKTQIPGIIRKLLSDAVDGRPDPKAKELFRKAKEKGIVTGVYSKALMELLEPNIREEGLDGCFDHIIGNNLSYSDSAVSGLVERVKSGKPDLKSHICGLGLELYEMAFIDNDDIGPLTQVGIGIASPTSKPRFKDACKERGIYTPESWEETAEILEIK